VSGTHEETPLVQDSGSSRIFIHLLTDILIQTVQEDVAKLVTADDCLVIDILDTSEETGLRVVGEDE
jgi:hypothetical protein